MSPLEQVFQEAAGKTEAINCKVLSALVEEAEDMIRDAFDESVRDAAIIAAAQRVEHYEIAAYGAVRHFAQILGQTAQAQLLNQTMKKKGTPTIFSPKLLVASILTQKRQRDRASSERTRKYPDPVEARSHQA